MRDNGLTAAAYTSMGPIDPLVAEPVLAALAEAGIAAYAAEPGERAAADETAEGGPDRSGDDSGNGPAEVPAEAPANAPADLPTKGLRGSVPNAEDSGVAASDAPAKTAADAPAKAAADAPAKAADLPAKAAADGPAKTAADAAGESSLEAAAESSVEAPATTEPPPAARTRREEIFVDARSAERARAVINRSTEDAEWKSLVEQFNAPAAPGHGDSPVGRWPASEDVDQSSYEPLIDVPSGMDAAPPADEIDEEDDAPARGRDQHDHYVPPDPPRGPRLDWISRAAWLGAIGGPVLLVLAALFDFGASRITLVAVVGFAAGFLTLVIRMKDRLPGDDSDDGAVV